MFSVTYKQGLQLVENNVEIVAKVTAFSRFSFLLSKESMFLNA